MAPHADLYWGSKMAAGVLDMCPGRKEAKTLKKFSECDKQAQQHFVKMVLDRCSGGKRPPQQPISALDKHDTKKAKPTPTKPRSLICRSIVCREIARPKEVDHKALFCPQKVCKTCKKSQDTLVMRSGGKETRHGQNCPLKPMGVCARAAPANTSASAAAPHVGGDVLATIPSVPPVYGVDEDVRPPPNAQQQQQQQQQQTLRSPSVGRVSIPDYFDRDDFALLDPDTDSDEDEDEDEPMVPGSPQKHYDIVTAMLERGKWHVGPRELQDDLDATEQDERYLLGLKTYWTQRYHPIAVVGAVPAHGTEREREAALKVETFKVMHGLAVYSHDKAKRVGPIDLKMGVQNVRGSTYVAQTDYSEDILFETVERIDTALDLCCTCHRHRGECTCRQVAK